MVLCLVTLTDLQTRRTGLSASAELLVTYCSSKSNILVQQATGITHYSNSSLKFARKKANDFLHRLLDKNTRRSESPAEKEQEDEP